MNKYLINKEHNGIEIYFDSFPSEDTRKELKENGWRWSPSKRCWYAHKSDSALNLANTLAIMVTEGDATETSTKPVSSTAIKTTQSGPTLKKGTILGHSYCYADSVCNFLSISSTDWLATMKDNFINKFSLPLENSQIAAWKDCFNVLQKELYSFNEDHPHFSIIFEYALPYESGRRPDVVLVSSEDVFILEFKKKNTVFEADSDQASAYQRDIEEYHYESRTRNVYAFLVETEMSDVYYAKDNITICSGDMLHHALNDCISYDSTACDIKKWIDSRYEPLPTIVEAAKMFVHNEELPNIRRVNSTCIPQAVECLNEASKYAKENHKHIVAFVTGVPGSGKTFLGLKYVYDICKDYRNVNSVYLSGNGPLVSVLTDALHSTVFVKDLHKVVNQYLDNGAPDFHNNIIVFDEGQRAWDSTQMLKKKGTSRSEPDVMVELCSKRLDWCVMLVLVGEGQEIHNGENSGIVQWNTAITNSNIEWEVLCPSKLNSIFANHNRIEMANTESLNLSQSLRTHLASDVSDFANAIISGNIDVAKSLAKPILTQGFQMYVTRDLMRAKQYLRDRYSNEPTKRYGLLASSKGRTLVRYGIDNSYYGALGSYSVSKWFNAEPYNEKSCCALKVCATEFSCQGLEMDMPLIGWDDDMLWDGKNWSKFKPSEPDDSDANTYRKNSYRVLLTRGRDGFIIFVPNTIKMDCVYNLLVEAGIDIL